MIIPVSYFQADAYLGLLNRDLVFHPSPGVDTDAEYNSRLL